MRRPASVSSTGSLAAFYPAPALSEWVRGPRFPGLGILVSQYRDGAVRTSSRPGNSGGEWSSTPVKVTVSRKGRDVSAAVL